MPVPTVVQVVLELDRGGLETMCADLAIELAQRGLRSVVVGLDRGGSLESRLGANAVEFVNLGGRRMRDPRYYWRVAQVIRGFRPTAVHAHSFGPLLYSVPSIWLGAAPRLVNTEHSIEYLLERRDLRRALRVMARSIHRFVVLGERMRRYYADEIGVAADRLRVIPNGVAVQPPVTPARRAAAREALGLGEGFLVATVGRLAPEKNFGMLIDAFAHATAGMPHAGLVFVGDGVERASLEARAAERGVRHRVHFPGWRRDVADILPAFDVFALSSFSEGLPMAMLEAMSAGVPVVSTAVGDIPEVITDGATGRLTTPRDGDMMAAVLRDLATAPSDRARMGEAGRALVVGRYSRGAMTDAYLEAYGLGTAHAAA